MKHKWKFTCQTMPYFHKFPYRCCNFSFNWHEEKGREKRAISYIIREIDCSYLITATGSLVVHGLPVDFIYSSLVNTAIGLDKLNCSVVCCKRSESSESFSTTTAGRTSSGLTSDCWKSNYKVMHRTAVWCRQ